MTRSLGRWLVPSGAVTALVGSFLPWLSSGAVDRSSYDLFDLVERLGFSPDGLVGVATRIWPLVPLVLVVSVVAQTPAVWAKTGHLAGVGIPLVAGAYVGAVCAAVVAAPDVGLFRIRFGLWVSALGALVMLTGVAVTLLSRGRPTDPARSAPA